MAKQVEGYVSSCEGLNKNPDFMSNLEFIMLNNAGKFLK
jgi:hypothetical protein